MAKESFLFVPYNVGQRSLADTKLTSSDARSHAAAVSRSRRDNSRLKAQAASQKSANSPLAPLNNGRDQINATAEEDDERLTPTSVPSPTSTSSISPTTKPLGIRRGQRRQHMRAMQFSWRSGNVSADFKISGSIPSSPIDFSGLTCFGQSVIDYYKQVISPVNYPIYKIFDITNVYSSYFMLLLQDEDYRPAGFAMVGAVMQQVLNPGSKPSEDVRSNRMTAISRLQKKYNHSLTSGNHVADDMTIITVLALASLARLLGDLNGYETHRKSMRSMVSSRGGLDALGHNGLVKCTLLQWDSFWVFETQGTPLFSDRPPHIPVYPAFPLSPDIRELFVKIPVGFQSLVMKGKISVELIEILSRAADATESGFDGIIPGSLRDSEYRKYHDFVEACPFLASDATRVALEKDICLAVLLYCSNAFTRIRSSTALYASCRMQLTRSLQQNDYSSLSQPERECLFWVCIVCIDSWRQNGPTSPLLQKGSSLLHVLRGIRSTLDTPVIHKFFCNQELLDGCTRYLEMAS